MFLVDKIENVKNCPFILDDTEMPDISSVELEPMTAVGNILFWSIN